MGKMIAKTIPGKEFVYSRKSAHAVSEAAADYICGVLNEKRYRLKDGEAWHVYDCGGYELEYTEAGTQKFTRRKGVVSEVRRYSFAY